MRITIQACKIKSNYSLLKIPSGFIFMKLKIGQSHILLFRILKAGGILTKLAALQICQLSLRSIYLVLLVDEQLKSAKLLFYILGKVAVLFSSRKNDATT